MTTPHHRRPAPACKLEPSQVATLAAKLERDALILHSQFAPGYGGLSGRQNAVAGFGSRPVQARLRLLAERHLMDSLRLGGHGDVEVWCDYPDDERPLDELYPDALVIARQGREPLSVPLAWSRGLKSLKFGAAPPVTVEPVTVLLGCQDSGEMLVQTVVQIVAAAVIALGGTAALEAA